MTDATWTVAPALRSRVDVASTTCSIRCPPTSAHCQIVFCRNVLIYFTAEHAAAFLDRLADALPPDAHLFLGGAESMLAVSDRFEPRHLGDTFVYRVRRPAPARRRRATVAGVAAPVAPHRAAARRGGRSRDARRRRSAAAANRPLAGRAPPTAPSITAAELARPRPRGPCERRPRRGGPCCSASGRTSSRDDPLAHFHLGLALEAGGDRPAALRSFGVSRSLLLRGDAPEFGRRPSAGSASMTCCG